MAVPPLDPPAPPPDAMTINASKADLRRTIRVARTAFAAGRRPLLPPPAFLAKLGRSGVIASYLPMTGEADPGALAMAATERGYQMALPHVTDRDRPMRFLAWSPGAPLATGPFGLRQPGDTAPERTPDIVLTPLIAFDAALNRLGQGAGYYDRAFTDLPAVLRIGVAWSMQQVMALPTEPWDMPLHGVITECGWIEPEAER